MTGDACNRHPPTAATATTPPRMVIEFLVEQRLEELGDTGLVARTGSCAG
jgi:hypothetical protein